MAETLQSYNEQRRAHWDAVAKQTDSWQGWGGYYHRRLTQIMQHLVAPGQCVLEIGCGQGDLLASVKPGYGVGVDFSADMVERASKRHPELKFVQADAHELDLGETFDVIILSD